MTADPVASREDATVSELRDYMIGFDDDYEYAETWYVYSTLEDRLIQTRPTIEEAQQTARDYLASRFGDYTFEWENSCQWVHAKSPNAGKPGMGMVDVFVYEERDSR